MAPRGPHPAVCAWCAHCDCCSCQCEAANSVENFCFQINVPVAERLLSVSLQGFLGKVMVECKWCLKDESHQSVAVPYSIPRTFSSPPGPCSLDSKHVLGMGGSFLLFSSSPESHPGMWGDRGTHTRYLPTKAGLAWFCVTQM